VVDVHEIFLDHILKEKGRYGKKYRISEEVKNNLKSLITGEKVKWDVIFSFLRQRKVNNELDFFMSINFFDIINEVYAEKFKTIPFTEYFWSMRSMLLPLFFILRHDIPEADLYHSASNGYAGILGAVAKFVYKKPFILTEHGIYSREREEEIIKSSWAKGPFKDMWIKLFYNICSGVYDRADRVFTLFEKNREIEIELGCSKDKIEVVPNGIDVKTFADVGKKEKDDRFINIGTITRVAPIKDIKTMIQSFNYVKSVVKNARFFVIGPTNDDEEYFKECKQLVKRVGLRDITFTGKVDVKDYIGKIDILVLTSISEGQPFVILEGMASSKPFVATDVGGCSELLYGRNDGFGNAGIIAPMMNIEKISKAIIKLCSDRKLREIMGGNGLKRVSKFYTSEECVKKYREIYNKFKN
jgi:glycosyltransferase involved in cell wall biosynthesis